MTKVGVHGLAIVAIGSVLLAAGALAQTGEMRAPKGPIEITLGTSPGGTPDVIMRRMAKIMAEEKIIEQPARSGQPHRRLVGRGQQLGGRQERRREHGLRRRAAGLHDADRAGPEARLRPAHADRDVHPGRAHPLRAAELAGQVARRRGQDGQGQAAQRQAGRRPGRLHRPHGDGADRESRRTSRSTTSPSTAAARRRRPSSAAMSTSSCSRPTRCCRWRRAAS